MAVGVNKWLGDLFRQHHNDLVRYAARLVGDRECGEEVVQNAYLRLAGRGAGAAPVTFPKSYAFTAARNAAFDFTAQQNREWLYRVDLVDVENELCSEEPSAVLHRKQRIIKIAVLLNELPPTCRTAFILNKIEGRRHREIAGQLGISVSMVEKHIMRALVHLRDVMRDED